MRFGDSVYSFASRIITRSRHLGLLCGAAMCIQVAFGQTVTALPAVRSAASAPSVPNADANWELLSAAQKGALAPLQGAWGGMSDGSRRKWLALAKTYPSLGDAEREKMHSRMLEWAALSPKDRELARLNYAQSKTLPKSDRAADWEAYQALSPEERQKLAQGAKNKPVGAAVVLKPVAQEKLATVPVTRHTPETERAAVSSQRPLNRNTLLPRPALAASDATASEAASKP